ncbi:DUF4886 domain-containing protein [Arcticibacter sp. MXS-1]|uniref:DUF4886 domain-containing protein n=1 Tax=Arcticibacter sp. MXS-1 TaxID=3341726 RepID=UPI0035A928D3
MMKRITSRIFPVLLLCLLSLGVDAKNVIKILAIGNSFSEDGIENYLYELGRAAGDSLVIGNLYIGGCSLETHSKNAATNAPAYSYRKIAGGTKTVLEKQTMESAIKDEPWDYISFQQVSGKSGIYDSYFPYLTQVMQYVKERASNPKVKYILHRTWAYAGNSTHADFSRYNKDQNEMFKSIVTATRKVMKNVKSLKFMVPSGTAIQNARTSAIGDHFNRDGYHLELNYGRYTAACTWFEALTGKSVIGNSYVPENVGKVKANIAQHAAHYAMKKPDQVTSMKNFSL